MICGKDVFGQKRFCFFCRHVFILLVQTLSIPLEVTV